MRLATLAPTLVSLSRCVLAPFIGGAILGGEYGTALAVFLVAGVTDVVDGFLARRFGQATRIGAYVDPIADKVLLSTVYVCLWVAGAVPGWLVGLVFGRDAAILLLAGGLMLFTSLRRFPPSRWGKLSTFAQISTAVAVMIARASGGDWTRQTAEAMIWWAAAMTAGSGIHYLWLGAREVRRAVS